MRASRQPHADMGGTEGWGRCAQGNTLGAPHIMMLMASKGWNDRCAQGNTLGARLVLLSPILICRCHQGLINRCARRATRWARAWCC